MANIRNISEIEPTLGFTEFDILTSYEKSFRNSELGRLHSIFPIKELSRKLGLKYSRLGRTSYFSPEGKIALMLLKSYTNLPDRLLIEQLNGNIHYQLFCGIMIHPSNPITNYKIVSAIRREIAEMIDIPSLQEVLAQHWKGYLNNKHVCMTDATCYESYLRFPTDVKLLWESVEWLYRQICSDCARLGIRRPRNKYSDVSMAYLSYSKNRKRKNSRTRMIKRRLLHLLDKLLYQTDYISTNYPLSHTHDYYCRLSIIRKVLLQGRQLFDGEHVNDRIVSIDKHYIRPIVRGKENKSVEFGAKVNNIQIDGISFIEHLSFDSFNEGRRLRYVSISSKNLWANESEPLQPMQYMQPMPTVGSVQNMESAHLSCVKVKWLKMRMLEKYYVQSYLKKGQQGWRVALELTNSTTVLLR